MNGRLSSQTLFQFRFHSLKISGYKQYECQTDCWHIYGIDDQSRMLDDIIYLVNHTAVSSMVNTEVGLVAALTQCPCPPVGVSHVWRYIGESPGSLPKTGYRLDSLHKLQDVHLKFNHKEYSLLERIRDKLCPLSYNHFHPIAQYTIRYKQYCGGAGKARQPSNHEEMALPVT